MAQAKPIDAALALDILQKLMEEGVRVTLTYQKREGRYHLKLEGRLWDNGAGEFAEVWGLRLEEACETALDLFRRAWVEDHGWTEEDIAEAHGRPMCVRDDCERHQAVDSAPYCFEHAPKPEPPEGPPLEVVSESGKIREPTPHRNSPPNFDGEPKP